MTEPTTDTVLDAEPTLPGTGGARRGFMFAGAGAAIAAFVAACGSDSEETTTPETGDEETTTSAAEEEEETTTSEGGGEASGGDAEIAAFAASLELLAVNTYTAAGEAAAAGDLGEVPPAVGEFVTAALGQHQEALDMWNGVVGTEATETPADLQAVVDEMFGAVTDVTGAAELALELEQIAAQTYLSVIPVLEDPAAVDLAASIMPIAQQHAAILLFVLGQYPVPDVFLPTDKAATPS
ncbi:MAG: ferritin-like domain-containing protein [Acidimicrobiales bacterium]